MSKVFFLILGTLSLGIVIGGSIMCFFQKKIRENELKKIARLSEALLSNRVLSCSEIGKETICSKIENQLIRLQEVLDGRRKEAERNQIEIQKLISEIAHQMRTPLANIKNYTDFLQESLQEGEESTQREYIKTLQNSEQQLCFLVEGFIKTARLEQGIIQVNNEKCDLTKTILNSLGQIQKKAESKNISFHVELPKQIMCEHDKNWMIEALYNLFDNSVKYSDNGKCVEVTLKKTEMFYKIQVRDYGVGIKEGEENKIFRRFYRGEFARGYEGYGIGLYLSRKIILLQNGFITAKQMNPGLLIEVNLPV